MTTTIVDRPTVRKRTEPKLVSAPSMKFLVGMAAALCAVFAPRLIAALTTADRATVTFISREYFLLALSFSVLVAVAVTILEWHVPRAPRDTFTMTLGLPAILAGALSASQGTTALQRAIEAQEALANELSHRSGIAIEPAADTQGEKRPGQQGALSDVLITPAYAEGLQPAQQAQAQSRLGIFVDQPRYFIVLDRAPNRPEAERKASELTARVGRAAPGSRLAMQIEKQGQSFLIVEAGGPRFKSEALIEALRVKDVYHLAPSLVEAEARK
jgi:hypothetical protein